MGLADWIRVKQIKDHSEKKMYKAKLHDGEVGQNGFYIGSAVERMVLDQVNE